MTVKELVDAAIFCDVVEIVIRENGGHGKWLQGYRIGKEAKIYPSELTREVREIMEIESYDKKTYHCKPGEVLPVFRGNGLPMKVICKDVSKIPEEIGNLEVADFIPRKVYPIHKDSLTSNNHELDINCYPADVIPDKFIESKVVEPEQLEGQMSIEQFLEGSEE